MDDLREMREMVEKYLGPGYDEAKFAKICEVRNNPALGVIADDYEAGRISAENYVDRFNEAIHSQFKEAENAIGSEDFVKLFEFPADSIKAFIDKETFLASEELRKHFKLPDDNEEQNS